MRCVLPFPYPHPTLPFPALHFPTLLYPTPPRCEKLVKLRFMFPEPIMDWPTCIQVEKHPYRCDLSSNLARAPRLDQSIFLFVIDLVIVIASVVVMIFCVGVSMSLQATLTHGLTHLSVAIWAQAALTVSPTSVLAVLVKHKDNQTSKSRQMKVMNVTQSQSPSCLSQSPSCHQIAVVPSCLCP